MPDYLAMIDRANQARLDLPDLFWADRKDTPDFAKPAKPKRTYAPAKGYKTPKTYSVRSPFARPGDGSQREPR